MWRWVYLAVCAVVLAGPVLAMQFTDEVVWGPEDFAAATALLALMWLAVELISRSAITQTVKVAAISVAACALVLVWAQLAVGVF